jgi:hypothetical protein
MTSKQNNILKVFFDTGETQKTISSFVPMFSFKVTENVGFWLKEKNRHVLSRIDPHNFCDWSEQDWYMSDRILWVYTYSPKMDLRDIMNSCEECQKIVMKKLEQVIAETRRLNIINPDTYTYNTDSIVKLVHCLRIEMYIHENFGHFLKHHVVPFECTLEKMMDWLNYHEHDDYVNELECNNHFVNNHFDDKCPYQMQYTKNHSGRVKKVDQKQLQKETLTQKQKKEEMLARKNKQRQLSMLKRHRNRWGV